MRLKSEAASPPHSLLTFLQKKMANFQYINMAADKARPGRGGVAATCVTYRMTFCALYFQRVFFFACDEIE